MGKPQRRTDPLHLPVGPAGEEGGQEVDIDVRVPVIEDQGGLFHLRIDPVNRILGE